MFSKQEKKGLSTLLSTFPLNELLSLVQTVTTGLVVVQHRKEAINAILLHSESAEELLHRKKFKREYIFQYLSDANVNFPATAYKESLINYLLVHWGSQPIALTNEEEDNRPDNPNPNHTDSTSTSQVKLQTLAEQFASWFYQQLNSTSQDDLPSEAANASWGPQHFWRNAKFKLCISLSSEIREDTFEGAELVAKRLACFVLEERLHFNPNVSETGTRGFENPHGLVVVVVCGTVHQCDKCLGTFEQQFGLIRDSAKENNYKIKFTVMNMNNEVNTMPTLESTNRSDVQMLYLTDTDCA